MKSALKSNTKEQGKGVMFERLRTSPQMREVWPLVRRNRPPGTDPAAAEQRFLEHVWATYRAATGPHPTISNEEADLKDIQKAIQTVRRKFQLHPCADPAGLADKQLEVSEALIDLQIGILKSPETYLILPRPNIDRARETYFVRAMALWFIHNLGKTHLTRLADLACCVFEGEELAEGQVEVADWLGFNFCNNAVSSWKCYQERLKTMRADLQEIRRRAPHSGL